MSDQPEVGAESSQDHDDAGSSDHDAGSSDHDDSESSLEMFPHSENHELRTLAIALIASLVLWNLPYGSIPLYPFKLFATWLHELSHGLAMIITGAGFDHIIIYRDTSGLAYAYTAVGSFGTAIIAAAGYMGTPLWGAALLVVTPDARTSKRALLVLGGLMIGTTILVIAPSPTGDTFGQWATPSIGIGIALCALLLPERWRVFGAHFIAAQACVNALLDIRVLLRPSQVVDGKLAGMSDAGNMALSTFGTTERWAVWTWAIIWLVWSLGVLFFALRISGSRASRHAQKLARATASFRDENDHDEHRHSPATAPGEIDPSAPADTEAP